MKIVAGTLGGRKLKTLNSFETRPTTEKIRGAIFNTLGQYFAEDQEVLDIFSGSGALAIEAISRGCSKAICIDKNRKASGIIKENCELLGIAEQVKVYTTDYKTACKKLTQQFDLIFIDPPYNLLVITELLTIIHEYQLLKNNGKIVVEYANRQYVLPEVTPHYQIIFDRKYDETQITILERS